MLRPLPRHRLPKCRPAPREERNLLGSAVSFERSVAMGKPSELGNDIAMSSRVVDRFGGFFAQLGSDV